MAQSPNPVELYEAAVQRMVSTLEAVRPDQLTSPTPCSEWDVQALINHNLRVSELAGNVLGGAPANVGDMFVVAGPLPSEGGAAAFSANTGAVLNTARSMDLAGTIETPFGPMPAGNLLMICMNDVVVHTWDVSKATGQNTTLDSGLAEVCYNNFLRAFEQSRPGATFFGPEVSVPDSASIQDKLLAFVGRTP
jgi:uncharacterized protein (TIGR03086 family)